MDKQTVFMNRELSWLKFNERVLEEAESSKTPLCERLSFASIYQSNLDEFFMVRVGSLVDQENLSPSMRENKTHMTPREQIDAVIARVHELNKRRDAVYADLMERLEEQGVRLVDFRKIGRQESERLERYFDSEIAPLISPSIVGRRQPFPFLRNKDIYAVVVLERKNGKNSKLGIIPCNAGVFPRLIEVSASEKTYMLAEDLILHFIPKVFEGYTIRAKSLIRVTRNADIDADALYDDDLDYREFMVELIKRRKRLANCFLQEGQTAAKPHGQVQKAMVHRPKLHGHLPVALARCLLAISGHALHPAIPPLQKIYYTTSRRTLQVVSRICATSAFSHCNLDTQSARCYTLEHPRMFFLCFSPICHAQGGCSP